jgi:alkaline phosphatase
MRLIQFSSQSGRRQRLTWALSVLLLVALSLSPGIALARDGRPRAEPFTSVNRDVIPRIQCPAGYVAKSYAEGLSLPDGLAFSPDGMLYVAEETAGRVSRIEADGTVTPVVTGLHFPEGIAFDTTGNLYVVEDVPEPPDWSMGRLLRVAPDGTSTTLATNLEAPEGVVWAPGGTLYVTESNVQYTSSPFDFRTYVTAVPTSGPSTRILSNAWYWSYAGIARGPDGFLYVTNEASGTGTHDSVFRVNPATGARTLFASNLVSPEGLRFGADGDFPLYVAQEDTGSGAGVLSRVEANGTHTPLCTGFYSIEDVIQGDDGRLYVSEDTSGLVIVIEGEPPSRSLAQAIMLFIGDGMGEAHRNAARWSAAGQSGALAMDRMPTLGWSHTASADSPVTDSAAAATALASGIKTNNGKIGQDPSGNPVTTILEQAQARGMAVGLVTNVQMAHATPAGFAAHVPDRDMMTEIASQMLAAEVDVLLGGGEDEFLPPGVTGCYPEPGERSDGRNLITEATASGYTYVCNASGLAAVDPASTSRLLGLFADEGMARPYAPSLEEMTQKAIEILSRDPDGFFLMVEGGQIDSASHTHNAADTMSDTVGFDEAVAVGQAYAASVDNTLIIVTADHETGGMSVNLSAGQQGPFAMPEGTSFYVSWSSWDHTGVDVPTTAQGPWSDLLSVTHENTYIHDVMLMALGGWPDISAIKTATPGHGSGVTPGGTITYQITLTNNGTADATGLVLTDTVPTHTTLVPGSQSASGTATESDGVLTFTGDVPAGSGVFTATFAVTVNSPLANGTPIANVASFTTDQTGVAGQTNSVSHTVVSGPNLALTLSADPLPGSKVQPGDWITYTVTAINDGTADATGVVISDTLDPQVHFVDVTPGGGVNGPNPLVFDVGTLTGNGGMVSYSVRVTVTNVTSDTSVTNMATLSSNETGLQESGPLSHPVQASGEGSGEYHVYLPFISKGP